MWQTIMENTMAPKSNLFQAPYSSTLLRSTALALLLSASPANAEILNLVCDFDDGGTGYTFLIDLDKKAVQENPSSSCRWTIDGKDIIVPDCNPPGRAEITERSINWKTTLKEVDAAGDIHNVLIEGSIDRLAGSIFYTRTANYRNSWRTFIGKCRRATQKF